MWFHQVGQATLELLTSGDSPTSASQSAEIAGVSNHALPPSSFFRRQGLAVLPRLVLNTRAQAILLPWLPKVLGL